MSKNIRSKAVVFLIGGFGVGAILIGCANLAPESTPLMLAARSGESQEVQRLIGEGKNVDSKSSHGWTALMFASSEGKLKVVKTLLDAGADPNIESDFIYFSFMSTGGNHPETTALREAIRGKHFDTAFLLMDRRASIDAESLALAGQFGNTSLLSGMARRGVNFRNAELHVPIMLKACDGCNLEAVHWLMSNGAGANTRSDRSTALAAAVGSDCPELVGYLLAGGANPNLIFGSSGYEETALLVAVRKHTDTVNFSKNLAVVSKLVSHGVDTSFHSALEPRTPAQIVRNSQEHTRQLLADTKTSQNIRAQLTKRLSYQEKMIRLLTR